MNEKRSTLEIIAPTIDEAIQEGLAKLNLPEDMVEIEILDEGSKGVFGLGSRQARVRLMFRLDNPPTEVEQTPIVPVVSEAEFIHDQSEGLDTLDESSPDDDDQILKVARDTVAELLEKMKVTADVTAYHGEPDDDRSTAPVHVDIHGKDLSILIGRKAETLNALQYITKLIVGKELSRSVPITVDVAGYRKRKERQVRQLAKRVAEQVKATGRSQALEPMPPNERRIVHIELRNDPDVFTQSTGEGQRRKVVIHPQN